MRDTIQNSLVYTPEREHQKDQAYVVFGNLELMKTHGLSSNFSREATGAVLKRATEILEGKPNSPVTAFTLKQLIADFSETSDAKKDKLSNDALSASVTLYTTHVDPDAYRALPKGRVVSLG